MIIFEATLNEFIENQDSIAFFNKINDDYEVKIGRRPSAGESNSWIKSIPPLIKAVKNTNIDREINVLIEYQLPISHNRIDVVFCGKDMNQNESAVIVELKQWSKVQASNIKRMVKTIVGNNNLMEHPSSQAINYVTDIQDTDSEFEKVKMYSISFMHNLSDKDSGVFDKRYKEFLNKSPIFAKFNADEFNTFIKHKLGGGSSKKVYEMFKNIKYNPSETIKQHAKRFSGKIDEVFNDIALYGDQKSAFNIIKDNINNTSSHNTNIFIIRGSAGTGKTVVALKLCLHFLETMRTWIMFPGTDFRGSMKKMFDLNKGQGKRLFNGKIKGQPTKPTWLKKNNIDLLIVDEAHKINKNSPTSGLKPMKDIISKVKTVVLLYDEKQVVKKTSYNAINLNDLRKNNCNVIELDLNNQFRCSGGSVFIKWIDSILSNDQKFIFVNNPNFKINISDKEKDLMENHENFETNNLSSRILVTSSSFPWTKTVDKDGKLYKDVKIAGKFLVDTYLILNKFEIKWKVERI